MQAARLSNRHEGCFNSLTSRLPSVFHRSHGQPGVAVKGHEGFIDAVHARENCVDTPQGVEVWKYSFPLAASQPVEDMHVRDTTGNQWIGVFECARGRHVDVFPWPAANALVIAAANALYIVDPNQPEYLSGFAAPVEITDVTFDETGENMFVADSLRIYAFSSDRHFRWISEPLEGYGAHFRGCRGRVLAVEVTQPELEVDGGEEAPPSLVRLRTEDGTILRSRFRLVRRYRTKSLAA